MELGYLVKSILKVQRIRFSLSVLMAALASLIEGVGVAAVVPLLQLVQAGGEVIRPGGRTGAVIGFMFDTMHIPFTLLTTLCLVAVLLVGSQVVTLLQQRVLGGSVAKFEAGLRSRLYRAVTQADWQFFVTHKVADVATAVISDCMRAGAGYAALVQMLAIFITVLVYLILAFVLSWQMTLAIALAGGVIVLLLRRRVMRSSKYGEALSLELANLTFETMEHVSAAKTVKAYSVEGETVGRFDRMAHAIAHWQYRNLMNQAWLQFVFQTISALAIVVGIYTAVVYFGMSMSALVVFMLIFYRVSPRISNVQAIQSAALAQIPGLKNVDALIAVAEEHRERNGKIAVHGLERALEFDDVTFSYDGAERPVLDGLSLSIAAREVTAIIGPSGVGKTTIVDLILGLVRPRAGRLTIDGVELGAIDLASWRRRIGYVAQDSSFFHASVRENIRFGSDGATDEQVVEAAKLSFAEEFISELPEGYETVIGDRGVRLSGGQRQRLALARAIVRNPDVLVLDEATSALDGESEKKIQKAVDGLTEQMTIIIVTHRLATVRNADRIFLMEEGHVVEQGSWENLVAAGGRFAEMQEIQRVD